MSYLDETLTSGEVVNYRTGLHWTVLFWPVVIGLFFGMGAVGLLIAAGSAGGGPALLITALLFILIGATFVFVGFLRRSSIEMAVTNRRVLIKSGILARRTVELMLSKVESVGVEQGIAGRIAGYGTVVIRGTGGTYEVFNRIERPLEFRRQVQEHTQPPADDAMNRQGTA